MKDETLDFFGVCNATDITDDDIVLDGYYKNYPKNDTNSQFSALDKDYNSFERPHYRAVAFHLYLDWDGDLYEPFACSSTTPTL